MTKHIIEYACECDTCKATGLYIGFAERDGAAVVCQDCKGTGKKRIKFVYKDFEKRRQRENIKRVFQSNPGIGIGIGKTEKHGKFTLEDFGGMPYKDWLDNKPFPPGSEMRRFTCPAWWYQSTDYDKKPHWKECIGYGAFTDCNHYSDKAKCWERLDNEQTDRKKGKP